MPFIWNNDDYMLVDEAEDWDRLEFCIARKLRVEYSPNQVNFGLIIIGSHCHSHGSNPNAVSLLNASKYRA